MSVRSGAWNKSTKLPRGLRGRAKAPSSRLRCRFVDLEPTPRVPGPEVPDPRCRLEGRDAIAHRRFVIQQPRFLCKEPRLLGKEARFLIREPRFLRKEPRFLGEEARFVIREPFSSARKPLGV